LPIAQFGIAFVTDWTRNRSCFTVRRRTSSVHAGSIAYRATIHPAIVEAMAGMLDLSYADAWRRLAKAALLAGARRPSYHSVRRIMIVLQRRAARQRRRRDPIADLLAGRVPWTWLDEVLAGEREP
jgi:hypothetical protein